MLLARKFVPTCGFSVCAPAGGYRGYINLNSEAPRTPPQESFRSLDADPPQPSSPWGGNNGNGNEPYASFSNSTKLGAPQVCYICKL